MKLLVPKRGPDKREEALPDTKLHIILARNVLA
jgi:hypothetical protein